MIVRGTSHGSVEPNSHRRVAPGRLAREPRRTRLPRAGPAAHPLRDVAQERLAELAHRLGREPQLAVGAALEVAAVAQRPLELLQGLGSHGSVRAELPGERVEVDVVHPRAVVRLRELVGERVELGEVLQRAGAVAETHPLVALEALRARPVLTGAQGLEVGVHPRELLHQLRRPEGLLRELHQLLALLGRHRVEHPLGGGRTLGERVEQLVHVLRVVGEVVAVLVHEVTELLVRDAAGGVLLQQVVEVGEHLLDGLPVLLGGALERLLHAGEALVEELAAEQVLDLLVGLARLRGLPVVRRQLADRGRGGGRQVVEHELAERAVAVVQRDVAGQLPALGEDGLVEQLLDLAHRAVEVVALAGSRAGARRRGGRARRGRPGRCPRAAGTRASRAPASSPP